MKIYDKEIYSREQTIKSVVLVIVVFLLGFFTGFIVNRPTEKQKVNQTNQSINSTVEEQNNQDN